jgi:multiple sugar transport system permease protein
MATLATPAPLTARAVGRRKAPSHQRPTWKTVAMVVSAYVIAFIFIFPYLDMILTALRPQAELQTTAILPRHYTISAFTSLWRTGLGKNLKVTLMVAGGATLLVLLVALPAAYYTSRNKFRGRLAFLLLVLVTQMFQPTAMLVGIYREFFSFHLLNTVWALILVNAGFNLAFAIWILNAYFSSIPRELEEAAMVEGTGRLGALFRVTLPLAMPGVVTALIFTFISAWNEFIVALTLTQTPSKMPLTVAINGFIGAYSIEWQHLFAASVVATIPVIILFALIERKVISGLTAGSIK